jgi:hypothetical protein
MPRTTPSRSASVRIGGGGTRIKRLDLRPALAQRMEREPVLLGQARNRKSRGPVSQARESLNERQADHREQRFALGQRDTVRPIRPGHGGQDQCWLSTSVPSQSKMTNFNDLVTNLRFIPARIPI